MTKAVKIQTRIK